LSVLAGVHNARCKNKKSQVALFCCDGSPGAAASCYPAQIPLPSSPEFWSLRCRTGFLPRKNVYAVENITGENNISAVIILSRKT
jgi:hypothetical protein